ncbi:membrane dipeptidase [Sediminibacillus dalangtanensis]|uniref:Membrane dipeptidase n=1 Tax=Sediminibacillus dalangtanensis TaxID=2729421 RepID=A0ABX7VRD4_9BACI|nr:membrane dipeptidase [Sediminibacillus dalangtanensis]QTM99482.1 membrane dipeptidase [Sediminibacillus dalangtanensis]
MIIDAHCDALYKMWEYQLPFESSEQLQVNYQKWMESPVKIQCFAIFVPPEVSEEAQFSAALEMVNLFYEQIIEPYDHIKRITSRRDIETLKEHEKGAMLTLEGCHVIGSDINKLKTLLHLGVKAVGLTWNQANAVCDGIEEQRGAGLSSFGHEVVKLLNKEKIWTDVSHLSYQGFWDVIDLAEFPMASHSNAIELASHKRNLDKQQIQQLIKKKAWIGITFVPDFLNDGKEATYLDVLNHISYYISEGAEDCLGLGSDFDGTSEFVKGLFDPTDYHAFNQELLHRWPRNVVHKITNQNFIKKFPCNG